MQHTSIPSAALWLALIFSLFNVVSPASGQDLTGLLEEAQAGILDQIDDFAIESCSPPCTGLICCDNGVCVHTVLACGAFPLQIDSFRFDGSPRAQMAGFATQGALVAEVGRRARLWFGRLDGEAWSERGIEPGYYEMVLQEGATIDRLMVSIVDLDGRQVARMAGHYWKFYGALDNLDARADWSLTAEGLQFLACHDDSCVRLTLDPTIVG